MKRLRHSRLRARLSLLAMVALLWTQLAMASHPACTLASMVVSGSHLGMAMADEPAPAPCHEATAPDAELPAGCETHCSRSDLAPDASRALSVPALGPLPAPPSLLTRVHSPLAPAGTLPPGPLRSWHRPTAHPASLLLI